MGEVRTVLISVEISFIRSLGRLIGRLHRRIIPALTSPSGIIKHVSGDVRRGMDYFLGDSVSGSSRGVLGLFIQVELRIIMG